MLTNPIAAEHTIAELRRQLAEAEAERRATYDDFTALAEKKRSIESELATARADRARLYGAAWRAHQAIRKGQVPLLATARHELEAVLGKEEAS